MDFANHFKTQLFKIEKESFDYLAIQVFNYQFNTCTVYKNYCESLGRNPDHVKNIKDIPFIPIDFFKNHAIKSHRWIEEKIFKSSGTTSSVRSHHHIKEIDFYLKNTLEIFNKLVGSISEYQLIALLPSYQEQGDSSLICMIDHFLNYSKKGSGYFLESDDIQSILASDEKKILIGVSYALLDLSTKRINSKNTLVMETGGMKGRKQEITRQELHKILSAGFNQNEIWSEYGMTELQSQAYGKNGDFQFPNWAKVLIRDLNDPFHYLNEGKSGGINIIDLANVDTCSFIETKDLGRIKGDYFEVLGRFDNSDIRGCNLMI
jgi:hypothetical protein